MPTLRLDLDSSLGGVFIGGLFSVMFYGFACAQIVHYCRYYLQRDTPLVKALVLSIWILDTAITVSDISILWAFIVQGHGNPFALSVFSKMYELEYATTAVLIFMVQIFYIHGIWQLLGQMCSSSLKWAATSLPMTLSLVSVVSAMVGIYVDSKHGWTISQTLPASRAPTAIRVCAAAVADVYLCIALTLALRNRMTGFKHTDSLIQTLTAYVVNRGILTTTMQIVLLGTYMSSIKHNGLIWAIFHCAGAKVYSTSMLAV
ncbi:uncharacterized protein C8Q71DRAFT_145211 [Rhodofomes roseus]|uniref:DUF6534 domain-containing protein n=1 Tax=Rhodofomes roseus TaxID=34475 RepID=A0ABQ8KBR7_9APHY|nr:uncharacterized protein C8Q71DRAFT_145211 [Rhodofomes roseus]KAH9834505.1 hypothetical protein C8Q71DRAFT_145211 [Rhodofomes roseus]